MAVTTTELQQLIITVLKRGHHVTSDQLHALVNSELAGMGSPGALKQRFTRVLQDMARTGVIERTVEGAPARYRMPLPPRYAAWSPGEGYGWCVRRTENVEIAGRPFTCIGDLMTEAEARTCVTALNEHDRKVRAVRQS